MSITEKAYSTYYHIYLGNLIKKYGLVDKIVFLGDLDEKEMCHAYLRCNVFVSCSSVENSSNAICEAMIMGVPSVVSDVGGTTSLFRHKTDGFIYQFGEEHMLAYYVMQLFDNELLCNHFSTSARKKALKRHNKHHNLNKLIQIYTDIIKTSTNKVKG